MSISKHLSVVSIAFAAVTAGAASGAQAQAAVDLDHLTATQAASDLCAGKYTSVALVSAVLARAKSRPELNAFITLDEAGALRAARPLDAPHKRHAACKPPGRVPVATQDNIEGGGWAAATGPPAVGG